MQFKELLDYCKAKAIENTLESTELTVWRSLCRSYSKSFNTPLHLVLDMNPEEVMLAVFEEQLNDFDEEKDIEHVLEEIYELEDPEYEKSKREELRQFIDKAEAEEEERLRLGKPIHKAMKNEASIPETLPKNQQKVEKKPVGGSVNLSYLEKMDSNDPDNGF